MTNFIVDGRALTAKTGENLLQACLGAGLDLPYFCWHPALGSVGACRQCAVRQYDGVEDTTGRLVMACMTPIAEGARFSITDPATAAFRAGIIEWLMVNHPHDCPVCEEGGECHLQDMTVMTGHAYRRYRFTKRTHRNQDLGPFIKHEMNRCIACYRCVRFYRDYAGGRDLDVFGAHDHVYFGRHDDGTLESEFSGNLVEVCPTGVFTDKPFSAHYARKWDMRGAPSICAHCGVGCNTIANERAGQLRRVVNRYSNAVNGHFLCDRGRFGYGFVNASERVRVATVRGTDGERVEVEREAAVARFAEMLRGAAMVVGIGSPRASLESNFALRTLVGAAHFYPGVAAREAALLRLVADSLASGAVHVASLREAEHADAVLVLGSDLPNAAPRAALAVRQTVRAAGAAMAASARIPAWHDLAVRNFAGETRSPLFIATPAATRLDDIAQGQLRAAPVDIARLGFAVAARIDPTAPAVADLAPELDALAATIAQALLAAERPLVVSGVEAGEESVIRAAVNVAVALRGQGRNVGLMLNVPECNSLGLALMAEADDRSLETALAARAALVITLETDIGRCVPGARLDAALAGARLVVLDHSEGATTRRAELVLPAASFAEASGTLVNAEGRAQRFYPPIVTAGEGREAWRWLAAAGRAAGRTNFSGWDTEDNVLAEIARTVPRFAAVPDVAPPEGFRIKGLRIASEPHRFSGRTAMDAAHDIREPKPPVSADSPFSATMEGYQGKPPPALLPLLRAPGWNSNQSLHRFQAEIEGPLTGGDPGVRLLEVRDGAAPDWHTAIPEAFAPREDMWHAVMLPRVFGDEEQSARAAPIRARMTPAAIALNAADAARLGAAAGRVIACEIDGEIVLLPLEIRAELPRGVAGVSGLAAMAYALPSWIRIAAASEVAL